MGLLATLGSGIAKNGIREPSIVAEKALRAVPTKGRCGVDLKIDKRSEVQPTNLRNEYVLRNIHMIGKDSNFERTAVQDYLSPFSSYQFARHKLPCPYNEDRAVANYRALKKLKSSKNSETLLFNSSRQYVEEMIPLLVTLTPQEVSTGHAKRIFRSEVFKEIPPITDFTQNAEAFANYVTLLTHSKFYYKKSSFLNGVIPKILRNILHPSNMKTIQFRDVNVYNDVIYFFSEKCDYATCRELFSQMKLESVKPNTKTFNLMLRNVLKNSHVRKLRHPLHDAVYYLKQMQHHGIKADAVTWVTCFNMLLEDMSRDVFLEKLIKSNVPITPQLVLAVLTSNPLNSSQTLKFLSEYSVPLNPKLFNFCMKKLLSEEKYEAAWAFVDHAHKNAGFGLDHESLNLFLRCFAEAGRLDLALLTFNTACKRYQINANLHSFDMLFKALVRNGYTSNFPIVLEFLLRKRRRHTEGVQVFSYWLSKARSIAKFNMKRQVTENDIEKANLLLDSALWTSKGLRWKCWRESESSQRKVFRYLGCIPTTVKPKPKHFVHDTSLEASAKKVKYKSRIRYLAIQNAMATRVPYAHDRYRALKEELRYRGIM
ncbi:LAQU0S24e00342g1_1 [Lachancea quebecensis]|uniref:Mitochondrial 15S rRNA processing factor CCM1 n=1 Tax=Lachancea quebecensis TaxID=1654605 RepID=A0A0P1L4Y4_9SACH|nr:LAQU0S24e00342g1_1 [Lachancea quebecensis]